MATALPKDIDILFECPVCFDSYKDPRILQCAHQFCLKCLERLVTKKPPALDKITCPTCRQNTPIRKGGKARNLPRPVLMNELQNLLKNLQVSSKVPKSHCDLCETEDKLASNYCYQCRIQMCDSCLPDHEKEGKFKGHKVVIISDSLFCQPHENVVTGFCHNCKGGICPKCAAKEHRKHNTEDIQAMAGKSRIKVNDLISAQKAIAITQTVSKQIKNKVQELTESKTNIVSQINRTINSLGLLKSKLQSTRDEVTAKTSADIKALQLYEADLGDLNVSRKSLIELGQYLLEKASDPELVYNATKLPETVRDTIRPPTVHRPAENKLGQLETDISKWIRECYIEYKRESLPSGTNEMTGDPLPGVSSRGPQPVVPHPNPTTTSTPKPAWSTPHSHPTPTTSSTPKPAWSTPHSHPTPTTSSTPKSAWSTPHSHPTHTTSSTTKPPLPSAWSAPHSHSTPTTSSTPKPPLPSAWSTLHILIPTPTTSSTTKPPLPSPHSNTIASSVPTCPKPSLASPRSDPLLPRTRQPVNVLTLKQTIKVSDVSDVTFNPKLSQLAVRTLDEDSPIQIYTVSGALVKSIGMGVEGLAGEGGLSIDPHDDMYLAPCADHLTILDLEGKVHDVIKVQGSYLQGVAYSPTSDQYIVTDCNKHRVVIIDAKSREVVSSFGSQGSGSNQFSYPCHVCVGDIRGRATIVVSDRDNHAVKLFDLRGDLWATKGSTSYSNLEQQQGVAVDPTGRVLVCDHGNERVVEFYRKRDTNYWKCVVYEDELGGRPWAIDIDPVNRLVAIVTAAGVQLFAYD